MKTLSEYILIESSEERTGKVGEVLTSKEIKKIVQRYFDGKAAKAVETALEKFVKYADEEYDNWEGEDSVLDLGGVGEFFFDNDGGDMLIDALYDVDPDEDWDEEVNNLCEEIYNICFDAEKEWKRKNKKH